jgi:hypothetical protein
MLRKLVFHLLPFLLPFVLYAGWVALARRKAGAAGGALKAWPRGHVVWLMIAGFGLVILSFVAVALFSGAEVGGTYVPPRLEDGQIVPAETR